MTIEANSDATKAGSVVPEQAAQQHVHRARLRQFPGLAAIGIYMILLAAVFCYNVVSGRMEPVFLLFSAFFIASSLGLMFLLRWAWALALAAVALMAASFFWTFSTQGSDSALVQGLLNLVFFLYLVRSELREKMR
jgi:glycerol-3-phosphate acyltransferase PlsY